MNHTHPIYVLIVLMFYILLHYWYKPSRFYYSSNRRLKNIIGGIIIILLCVFSVQDSDYFHYKEYISLLKSGHDISSLERVYIWIAEFVSYNYFLFRQLIKYEQLETMTSLFLLNSPLTLLDLISNVQRNIY